MADEPRTLPPVKLDPGYNPALDPVVRELATVDATDEQTRNRIEREAIEQTDNGPRTTDRATPPSQAKRVVTESTDEPGDEPS